MWDQRYAEEGFAYGTEPNAFLQSEYGRIPSGGRVLCLAEGEGRNAVFLARQGYLVTAVDQSSVGLRKALNLAADQGVEIETVVTDLADYDLGREAWDGIVSISAHMPPSLRKQLHAQVVLALKPAGIFILEAYTPRHLEMAGIGGPSDRSLMMSLDELRGELSGLDFLIGQEVERYISEGRYHQGESAVVEIVARKRP
ncbi:class I SAM-dependent methyltransferase [Microbulbifer thermotolerans]|uniref:Class I SAM-dependent methyltransferase n=1 Tax=Microbulbifer thermotolerans TaxID=252514 RepID=A0AB35HXC7_MICTH|nr:class I SAM-dependent methyltransferase [Microbulbifer thermotolerans]MCX2778525.1 class I SAM-dependent methyltransferase [Microbulbifer thermotolerans]MCX2794008.1 class I SAM-dependent methyltransferase [Microbulbifer thermotolerans]MCX2801713.1 class I SAM-dependent methyltransferase [Microbulbifer thermotolerans]MCX2803966.1 class I SAM-dependent methyltransferase [Microbulbifer thermotolerans]MCX2830794.1 class I SAM-dependent methyltransferase [Microbulbifer thermotolerans]